MKLSVLVPAYNEEKTLEKIIRRVLNQKVAGIGDTEIVIVNDASKDQTAQVMDKLAKEFPKTIQTRIRHAPHPIPTFSNHGKSLQTNGRRKPQYQRHRPRRQFLRRISFLQTIQKNRWRFPERIQTLRAESVVSEK